MVLWHKGVMPCIARVGHHGTWFSFLLKSCMASVCVMGPVLALSMLDQWEQPLIRMCTWGLYLWLFKALYRNDKLILLVSINPYPFPTSSSLTCMHTPHLLLLLYHSPPPPHTLTFTQSSHSHLFCLAPGRGSCEKRSTKMPCESIQTTQKSTYRPYSSLYVHTQYVMPEPVASKVVCYSLQKDTNSEVKCAICLEEYQVKVLVRQLMCKWVPTCVQ